MVTSLRFLLIILALLLCTWPVLSQDVSIEQAGSTKEPYDVGGSLDIKVPVSNNIGSSMYYTVKLIVGPNFNDYSIFEEYTTDATVGAHSSSEVPFSINFRIPKFMRGDYGLWAADKNDTSIWEKTWYRAEIVPLIGDTVVLERYDGHPRLFKAFFDFRNPESPRLKIDGASVYRQPDQGFDWESLSPRDKIQETSKHTRLSCLAW